MLAAGGAGRRGRGRGLWIEDMRNGAGCRLSGAGCTGLAAVRVWGVGRAAWRLCNCGAHSCAACRGFQRAGGGGAHALGGGDGEVRAGCRGVRAVLAAPRSHGPFPRKPNTLPPCPSAFLLQRSWFTEGEVEVPAARHLDIILYSREQLVKEYAAMPTKAAEGADPEALLPQAPWGIISIKVGASGIGSIGSGAVCSKPYYT